MRSCFCLPSSRTKKPLTKLQDELTCAEDVRRVSFFTAVSPVSEDEARESFARSRIPTKVDLLRHPSDEWWSDARLDAPHVSHDLGAEPQLLCRTFQVKILSRDDKSSNELEAYFPESLGKLRSNRKYIVMQLLLGRKMVVSIGEVGDSDEFESLFSVDSAASLCKRLKLIVNPANVSIPWPITGPKDASSIEDFFGMQNCSVKRKHSSCQFEYSVITIDVFSKFMIRSFLPKLAFQLGRVSDYMLIDYDSRTIVSGFRLVCTKTLYSLMKP